MTALASPFVWFGVLSVVLGLCIAVVAWSQRGSPGAQTYALLMIVLSVWSSMYVVQLLQSSVAAKRPWLVGRHALTPVIGTLFWLFAARYTDRTELLSARYTVPILGVGTVLGLVSLFNPMELYWTEMTLYTAGGIPRLDVGFGPAFWLMTMFVFVVVGGGHVYFVLMLLDSFTVYRRQLTAMAVVGSIEFGLMTIFLTEHITLVPDLNPWPHVQLITYNMVFVAAPLGWSYLRQSLFDIQVLDRQTVIENMEDAVFVFDTEDALRRVNDHGRMLVDLGEAPEGASAAAIFADHQEVLERYQQAATRQNKTPAASFEAIDEPDEQARRAAMSDGNGSAEPIQIPSGEQDRWYDIRVSPIENSANEQTGTVLVARDVTVRRRHRAMLTERTEELRTKKKTLERQNERLDQFAGVVSHDLRNPLNVAQLRLELMDEEAPTEHVEVIERNLTRMESMIDELLTMARAETTVNEREPVELGPLVQEAWETVPAENARLDATIDMTVEGDRDLLLNVFENLFRNSVEHGRESRERENPESRSGSQAERARITVHVGTLANGFYVEDDGRGIPENRTDELFQFGQTTSDDGTGFGLAIVRELVRAHGWEIRATNGPDGGARFEIETSTGDSE